MSSWPLKMALAKGKASFPLDAPKQCPCAHKHISWANGDDYVFCWDCNQSYPLTACCRPPEQDLSESEEPND
jgi:hypothetical protein